MQAKDAGSSDQAFTVVGIGASAGGLDALMQLLGALPADTGMAFVVVQHLAPDRESALAEILSRATKMPVTEVHDEPQVLPDCVYVIPPGRSMVIAGGSLALIPRGGRGLHHPINQFFRSLAEEKLHRAIGVVLSGSATDGTLGLEEIKAAGGITFAQDATAQYDGMPSSAIASGCVDFVLPPAGIAAEIARIARHPYAVSADQVSRRDDRAALAEVLQWVHRATGIDFTGYKFNTLHRRIQRRMVFHKLGDIADYLNLLRKDGREARELCQDILISVTSFFRDAEIFEALEKRIFPRFLHDRPADDPMRIWVVGCSTGQEAYSLAISYMEAAEAAGSSVPLQLFASDLSSASIDKARAGLYPSSIADDVPPARLRRYFTEVEGGQRVAKAIRDVCVFSQHNVLADSPFSRIDLISCRNLLIYLEPALQQRVMPTLHYALKPNGCLLLGSSESIGAFRDLFDVDDAKHRIYCRRPGSRVAPGRFALQQEGLPKRSFPLPSLRPNDRADLPREADRYLLSRYAPPSVLVSAGLEILQFRGDTGPYLAPMPGTASLNLLKMLREGLLVSVRAAIMRASRDQAPVREDGLCVESSEGSREVAVEVIPMRGSVADHGGFLIVFDGGPLTRAAGADGARPSDAVKSASEGAEDSATRVAEQLRQELVATREYLQAIVEEHEAANDALQSANEEVQSANEELQSTNEELETSKEEIQSSNEELATVNDELNARNAELLRVNNELVHLMAAVDVAIVIFGPSLRIRSFTEAAARVLHLVPADVGRSLDDVKLDVDIVAALRPMVDEVRASGEPMEKEVQDRRGRWHSLRLRPYEAPDESLAGLIVVLVDIDAMKRVHERLRESDAGYRAMYAATSVGVCEADPATGLLVRVNEPFAALLGYSEAELLGKSLLDFTHEGDKAEASAVYERLVSGEIENYEIEKRLEHAGGRSMWVHVTVVLLKGSEGHPYRTVAAVVDISERKRLAEELHSAAHDLAELARRKDEFIAMLAHELRNPLAPLRNALELLRASCADDESTRSSFAMMERQLSQLIRLVDDLLDVSRISRNTIELRKARVELATVARQVAEASRFAVERAKLTLSVDLPPDPLYLVADGDRLAQVLSNLLGNACKFTPAGGRIRLALERSGQTAIVRVHDTGIGLASEEIPRVFDLFVQLDKSAERSRTGLGIGLTLVKRLVELHGGTVEVTSDGAGRGSEFVVRLPIEAASDEEAEREPEASSEPPTTTACRRILVVDDNRDAALSLAMLLRATGHETMTAHDGLAAVEAVRSFRPDAVLLDLGLPKLDGLEAARRIRGLAAGRRVLLVALTGWGQSSDRRKTAEAGFDAHIVKPVEYTALMKLLYELGEARGEAGE